MPENTIKMRIPTTEEWDLLMDATNDDNIITHWERMFSWVYNKAFEDENSPNQALRGYDSARYRDYSLASFRYVSLGFRPAFDALPSDFLSNSLEDGDTIVAGTLYMNGKPVKVPLNPVLNGDIEDYIPGSRLSFGPALDDPTYNVTAIKVGDIFIVDRALLKNISYSDIETALSPASTEIHIFATCPYCGGNTWTPCKDGEFICVNCKGNVTIDEMELKTTDIKDA